MSAHMIPFRGGVHHLYRGFRSSTSTEALQSLLGYNRFWHKRDAFAKDETTPATSDLNFNTALSSKEVLAQRSV